MHHFVQEGGDSLKPLSSVQPPGMQTNKEDIKTCNQRGKEMALPLVFPSHFAPRSVEMHQAPGQSLPYSNPQPAHISLPVARIQLSVTGQERARAEKEPREGTEAARKK